MATDASLCRIGAKETFFFLVLSMEYVLGIFWLRLIHTSSCFTGHRKGEEYLDDVISFFFFSSERRTKTFNRE